VKFKTPYVNTNTCGHFRPQKWALIYNVIHQYEYEYAWPTILLLASRLWTDEFTLAANTVCEYSIVKF
jgi:hypothetical protein